MAVIILISSYKKHWLVSSTPGTYSSFITLSVKIDCDRPLFGKQQTNYSINETNLSGLIVFYITHKYVGGNQNGK